MLNLSRPPREGCSGGRADPVASHLAALPSPLWAFNLDPANVPEPGSPRNVSRRTYAVGCPTFRRAIQSAFVFAHESARRCQPWNEEVNPAVLDMLRTGAQDNLEPPERFDRSQAVHMNAAGHLGAGQGERGVYDEDLGLRFDELHAKYTALLKRSQELQGTVTPDLISTSAPQSEENDYSLPPSRELTRVIMHRVKRYVTGPRLRSEILGQLGRGRRAADRLSRRPAAGRPRDEPRQLEAVVPTAAEAPPQEAPRFPAGHYYSPMYDAKELAAERETLWPPVPRTTIGLDWRDADQLRLCQEIFAQQQHLAFRETASDDPTEYYAINDLYPPLDAWVLEAILRHFRPRRMIEVGCGFSTLVSARVNREHLGGEMRVTCIEPYPRPFLDNLSGVADLRVEKVQDTPIEVFAELQESDILFIDTSHTVKTGGDVNWIYHEIIPRLAPGVVIHLHDIFLPREYPESWVMERWGWNEAYLVRSFLSFNAAFEILWGTQYMLAYHEPDVLAAFPGLQRYAERGGASFWIRRSA